MKPKLKYLLSMCIIAVTVISVVYLGWWGYSHSTLSAARNHGGTYTVTVPEGGIHISTAWKGEELWIETYYPKYNTCVYQQESQYGVIEGKVVINSCNYRSASK